MLIKVMKGKMLMKIILNGKQEEVLALQAKGHVVVLGTAGSGKTTIALYRAIHLSKIPNSGKILLVTFNNALVKYMQHLCDQISNKLVVENYHKFARGYLNSRGKMPRNCILNDKDEKYFLIEKAVNELRDKFPEESTFKRPKQFFVDEIVFIQRFGYLNYEDYQSSERIGRSGANIKRENRKWVYQVYERYLKLREEQGKKYDWDDIAFYVYNELKNDKSDRRYNHIIIDEGQDFSPMMIRSLAEAVNKNGSLTFFGDVSQQIYGSRLSWRDSGIDVNKIWRFDINYRNPVTVAKFAKSVTENKYWSHDKDMVDMQMQVAEGPKPSLLCFSSINAERQWIVKQAVEIGKLSSVAIICRNRAEIDTLLGIFRANRYNPIEINKNTPGYADEKKVYLTTYHAAKGLEFENVIIPYLSAEKFPDPELINNSISPENVYSDELKLLYVAATRSKFGLYMTYSGNLSPLFPEDTSVYDFVNEEEVN